MIRTTTGAVKSAFFATSVLMASIGQVAGQEALAEDADLKATMAKDKTGTNPVNFTHDLRLYNEYQFLNVAGDGFNNITTLGYRHPLGEGKWQVRTRVRGVKIVADTNNDGTDDVDELGLGDIDFRVLTVPYLDMPNKFAVATGLEVFLPTASDDALGTEALSLGPQVFGVFFTPFGIPGSLIAPAYQHKFSIAEESGAQNVHQGLFDLFVLWTSKDKQTWALINPQMVLDYKQDREFGFIDVEVGRMIGNGHSVYVRPSVTPCVWRRPLCGTWEASCRPQPRRGPGPVGEAQLSEARPEGMRSRTTA